MCVICTFSLIFFSESSKDWSPGPYEGILLCSNGRLSSNVHVITNKLWSSQGQPMVNLFSAHETKHPRDKSHGFMTFTFTRALRRNVKKRLKKIIEGPVAGEEGEKDGGSSGGQVYLNEVCLNFEPCDFVLNCPALLSGLEVFSISSTRGQHTSPTQKVPPTEGATAKNAHLPLISSSLLPLLYVTASRSRLFIPRYNAEKRPAEEKRVKSTRDHDMCVMQVASLTLAPHADNPLPRTILDKEVYRRAMHAGMLNQPGSEVEDRQYQLDVTSLSLCTGQCQQRST